jgi:cytochrome c55X
MRMRGPSIAILFLIFLSATVTPAGAMPAGRAGQLAELVAEDCGACHGMTRKGGLGSPLLPEAMAALSDEAIVATILDGRPGTPMPPWRNLLSAEDAAWIARYLKGQADVR